MEIIKYNIEDILLSIDAIKSSLDLVYYHLYTCKEELKKNNNSNVIDTDSLSDEISDVINNLDDVVSSVNDLSFYAKDTIENLKKIKISEDEIYPVNEAQVASIIKYSFALLHPGLANIATKEDYKKWFDDFIEYNFK